ncbi:MAG: ThuA domain-containing protein [Verrucomicrobia bacterium]|nr:ThuA domain-containing protein [Verrucomicrobiota bacterium]
MLRHTCFTLASLLLWTAGSTAAQEFTPKHVVLLIGENEYNTWETLPEFAENELKPRGLKVSLVTAPPTEGNPNFTNWQAIKDADALVVSVRRRTPPKPMMDLIRQHVAAGKAVVGIRTASHAFDATPPDDQHAAWPTFDVDVLGMKYEGHYGNKPPRDPPTVVKAVPEAVTHPVLTGVPSDEFRVTSHLYKNRRPAGTVTPLLRGWVEGRAEVEPVAWVFTGNNRRVFYTSLGSPDDFKLPVFRRLLLNGVLWALDLPVPPTGPAQTHDGPFSPAESLASFTVPDDLELDQVLAEPIVRQPVFCNFDERGRLWVVQYIQYPYPAGLKMLSRDNVWRAQYDKVSPPPPNQFRGEDKITIHEDTDGDGVLDKHKTFVEGLNIVTAVERGRGGVWVLNPPYLLFYPDKNRDDIPDGDPVVHLEGFWLEDTHAVVNSLRWGPDGWLYAAQGSTVSADIKRPGLDDKPIIHTMGQQIWRYHPGTRRFEVFAEGGGNAFGVELDAKGRIFSGHNGGNTRGFHYVQGGYLQKGFEKHGPLSNPYAFGYFPPMKHPDVERFTHNFIIYDGGALPERYRGKLFGVEPLQGRVVLSEIEPEGSTFRTRDLSHPVTTTDKWFKPVDIKLGPDGALYVCDWYDRQVNHYSNHEGQIDKSNGRIYRLKAKGAKPVKPVDLGKLSSEELVGLLKHPNKWRRQTALRLLADRRDKRIGTALLKQVGESSGQLALEALWALHLCGGFAEEAALKTLEHADPYVRQWTVRLLGDAGKVSSLVADKLAKLAALEPHVEVRSQLASTARRLPAGDGLPIVRNLLARDEDTSEPRLPSLLWWSIEAKAESDREAVLGFFKERAVWGLPLVKQHILERVMRRCAQAGTRRDLLACAEFLRLAPTQEHAAKLLAGFEAAFKGRSLAGLPTELAEALAKFGGVSLALDLRSGKADAVAQALRLIEDEAADKDRRVQLVQILGEVKLAQSVPVLLSLLRSPTNGALQKAALVALQQYDEPKIGAEVVAAFPSLKPEDHAAAFTLLATRAAWAQSLLAAVEAGQITKPLVPQDAVAKLRLYKEPRVAELFAKHFGQTRSPTTAEMQQLIERAAAAIRSGSGSPYEGQKLFTATCAACHKLFGQGGQIGPDLTVFKRDDLDNMLLSIVNPTAEIREGYENHLVTTKDDRTLSGFIVEKDNRVLVLRGLDGENVTLALDQVEQMERAGLSLMPEGLLDALTDQQIRDLFAYLRSTQPLVR